MPTETLRILVVDDETGMRLAVARVLNSFQVRLGEEADGTVGFDVHVAETGEEALEITDHLVRSGAQVEAVISVLEAETRARPATQPLLRVLGDAYVHTNRLQEALDVYRQALTRL
jgi:CheY-like chemotaxis protein